MERNICRWLDVPPVFFQAPYVERNHYTGVVGSDLHFQAPYVERNVICVPDNLFFPLSSPIRGAQQNLSFLASLSRLSSPIRGAQPNDSPPAPFIILSSPIRGAQHRRPGKPNFRDLSSPIRGAQLEKKAKFFKLMSNLTKFFAGYLKVQQ